MQKADINSRSPLSLDNMDIRLIRIFVKVVEAGGLSAAQAELNLSLSTISEKISALEQRLGITLCKRGRSGFQLTESGRLTFEECQRLFGSLDQFSRKVAGLRSNLSGSLSVGMVDNTIADPNSPLASTFAGLVDLAPAINLSVDMRAPGELLRDVVARKLDLAIGSFPRMALGLAYIDLYDETQNFYCGAGHPLYSVVDEEIGIDLVRTHRIIGRSYWASRDIKIFAIANPHATVSNMEAEAFLILSGCYLGYLPEHYAAPFVQTGRMRMIRPNLFSYKAKFQVAALEDWKSRPVVKTFIDILTQTSNNLSAKAGRGSKA
ncbi:LysR family transcriptional regulator [Rhizobium oryzicola]|uniref:LysR family transcriptional regulator n=1 Tax=Rhizobium oryzicola TaxID=1232668 RepID=A0ABT8SYI9_9HYPH|nr:LysR family transcriptional regulator [Rhizobium oryzicola]MDO1583340.1 LysR family transcriptional regulator [Rhizobium oryzicola]